MMCSAIPQSSDFTFRLSENDEVCSNIRSLVHLLRNSHASVGLPPVWWAIIIIVATSKELSLSNFHDDHFPCPHSQPYFWQMSTDQIHEICKYRRLSDGKMAGPIADTSQARNRTIFLCQIVSFGCHLVIKHRKNCECCPGHYLIVDHNSSI